LTFADGKRGAVIDGAATPSPKKPTKKPTKKPDEKQPDLF